MDKGILILMALTGHSLTQALSCQHSSGNDTMGISPFSVPKKTSEGQISIHIPHPLHSSLLITGGIFLSFYSIKIKKIL
jgi:hypothetical protein